MRKYNYNNVINYPYIDYIIKGYVPELQEEKNVKLKRINMDIFREAMSHVSTKYKTIDKTYERLEYLGDALFHLVITEYLFKRYDEENEGFLTKLRIQIERGDSMAEFTKLLGLKPYIQICGISLNDHILEDVFEAFIGAFYLSFNIKYSKQFIFQLVEKHKNLAVMINHDDNYKDLLLRYFHQMKWGHPIYEEEVGTYLKKKYSGSKTQPKSHRSFISIVRNPFGNKIGKGVGNSKKKAEQIASKNALKTVGVIINGEIDDDWSSKIEKVEKETSEKKNPNKKSMSVFNPDNILLDKKNIKKILGEYDVNIPTDANINIKIFYEAMTHRSYLVRKKMSITDKKTAKKSVKLQKKSNERLRFLGDAVIHFVIAEFLYHKYPAADEGFLTRLRCKLENRESLFYLAKQTDIGSYLLVSQNIEILHGRNNVNIIGGGFEAFVGAVYLEFGLYKARQFILEVIRVELDITEIAENETNYKDLILQLYNKNHWGHPKYKILKKSGPDHCKIFTMGIFLNNELMGKGKAKSKKKAEQIASKKMYLQFVKKNKKHN